MLFSLSNIVCLPTFYGEGIPKVIIEACASRRAVISSNIAGCKEIIEDNFNGILIEPKNSNQLAAAIVKLLASPNLRYMYGSNGRKLVKSKFGESRYFKISEKIYKELDERLAVSKYLAGKNYTIADIATFPWIARHEWHDIGLSQFKNLTRWYNEISKRDAVIKGFSFMNKNELPPKA